MAGKKTQKKTRRKPKPTSTSAAGERRALIGLVPQYQAAASLVLRALVRRDLEFLELTNDENGAVDDIVIGTATSVNAYQVKWSEYTDSITFKGFTGKNKNGRTLVGDLYDGHKRLSQRFPTKRINVYLYTCDYPSTSDNCRSSKSTAKLSFAEFVGRVWDSVQSGDLSGATKEADVWDKVVVASGATAAEFPAFVRDCWLAFGVKGPSDIGQRTHDEAYERDQITQLSQLLMQIARDPNAPRHLSRDDLLRRLNWTHFFEQRNRHEFSITPGYEEIADPAERLNKAIDEIEKGYIFVGGSPGSGKSSLLTRTYEMRAAKERWIRYYAFVPGSHDPGNVRGESENFLHDLTTALEDAGVHGGVSHSVFDRQQLIARLHQQLIRLGEQFSSKGLKTVILVDGLDHIPREQNPSKSLLHDLPFPTALPKGVVVILGSQTEQLTDIPVAVRTHIQEASRRVLMQPLSPQNVSNIVDKSSLSTPLSIDQKRAVFDLSQGHPLAVGLLVNHLLLAASPVEVDAILASSETYSGDIDVIYEAQWQTVANDFEVVRLLALLGRLRRHVDLSWLHTFTSPPVMAKLKSQMQHLFQKEGDTRWFFFHNSFRLFVRRKTDGLLASFPAENDRLLHGELAKLCKAMPSSSPWNWEALYHLAEAEKHPDVLALATTAVFRGQLELLRPVDAILSDIRHALRSAGTEKDVIATIRLTLAAAEFQQRANGIDPKEFSSILLRVGGADLAIEQLFDGRELRVSNVDALQSCRLLQDIGRYAEARRLFELSEPISARVKSEGMDVRSERESLRAWVQTAIAFRPLRKVLAFIEAINAEAAEFNRISAEDATSSLRNDLLFHLILQLRSEGRFQDATDVEAKLLAMPASSNWWFWLQVREWQRLRNMGDPKASLAVIDNVLARVPFDSLSNEERTTLVEGLFKLEGISARVKDFLSKIAQPQVVSDYLTSGQVMEMYRERHRVNRLFAAVGRSVDPVSLVPDSKSFEGQGNVYFERAVIRTAQISGDASRGIKYSNADIRNKTGDILRLFDRGSRERLKWRSWHSFESSAGEFYSQLVHVVAEHGSEAVRALRDQFDLEWSDRKRGRNWSSATKRTVILAFFEIDLDQAWASTSLQRLEADMLSGHDISGRVNECKEQAKAWTTLGETAKGLVWLRKLVSTSFGIGYRKDYQLENWLEWLPQVNAVDPAGSSERFAWFAAATIQAEESTEGRTSKDVARSLLSLAAAWSPRRAVKLFGWFHENLSIWYAECEVALLNGLLDRDDVSVEASFALLGDVILRYATTATPKVVEKAIANAAKRVGREEAKQHAIEFAEKVHIYAMEGTKYGWLTGVIRGLDENGLGLLPEELEPSTQPEKQYESSIERHVTLSDGTEVKGEKLQRQSSTVDGLLALVAGDESNSYFRWEDAFKKLLPTASLSELQRLATAAASLKDPSLVLSALSREFSKRNERNKGWSIAQNALATSKEYGWTRMSDGGTRVEALAALVEANPIRGREIALKTFIGDASRERAYASDIVRNFYDIVALINSSTPVAEIWSEIEVYLHALCTNLTTTPTSVLSVELPNDVADAAIVDQLVVQLLSPVGLLNRGAQHALCRLIMSGNAYAIAELKVLLLSSDDRVAIPAMGLIEALAERRLETVRQFTEELKELVNHQCLPLWCGARDILSAFGIDVAKRPLVEVPGIYNLELPDDLGSIDGLRAEVNPGEPLPDPLSYLDALTPFHMDIEWVARFLDRPAINLLVRTRAIMAERASDGEWTSATEKALRARLEGSSLKFTFHRPRGQFARPAMYRAITELFDAQLITGEQTRFIYEALRSFDPVLMLAIPARRPKEVAKIEGIDDFGDGKPEWVNGIADASSRTVELVRGNPVIAEHTTLKAVSWEEPTLKVRSGIVLGSPGVADEPWQLLSRLNIKEYASMGNTREAASHAAVAKVYDGRDSDCSRWLALTPSLGRHLGWKVSNEGLFRWVDNDGQTMAETIWWKDSTLEHRPPHHRNEVGEGWLVVMSKVGYSAFATKFPRLQRLTIYSRQIHQEGDKYAKKKRVLSDVVAAT